MIVTATCGTDAKSLLHGGRWPQGRVPRVQVIAAAPAGSAQEQAIEMAAPQSRIRCSEATR